MAALLQTHGHTLWRLLCDSDAALACPSVASASEASVDGPSLLGLVRYGRYFCSENRNARSRSPISSALETPSMVAAALAVPLGEVMSLNAWQYQMPGPDYRASFHLNSRFMGGARVDFRPATRPLFHMARAAQMFATKHVARAALAALSTPPFKFGTSVVSYETGESIEASEDRADERIGRDATKKQRHQQQQRQEKRQREPRQKKEEGGAIEEDRQEEVEEGKEEEKEKQRRSKNCPPKGPNRTIPSSSPVSSLRSSFDAELESRLQPISSAEMDVALEIARASQPKLERRNRWYLEDLLLLQDAVIKHRHAAPSSNGSSWSGSAISHRLFGMAALLQLPMKLPKSVAKRRRKRIAAIVKACSVPTAVATNIASGAKDHASVSQRKRRSKTANETTEKARRKQGTVKPSRTPTIKRKKKQEKKPLPKSEERPATPGIDPVSAAHTTTFPPQKRCEEALLKHRYDTSF